MKAAWMHPMRRALPLLAATLALALAGCMGDDDARTDLGTVATSTGATVEPTPEPAKTEPLPAAGETLLEFIRAAERAEVVAMWSLLSEESRIALGPTLGDFEAGSATEFAQGVGSLAKDSEVILSEKITDKWAVAAIAAERTANGKTEYYAYGVALTPQQGRWKIELGEVLIHSLRPKPLARTKPTVPIGMAVQALLPLTQAGIWVDGKATKERGTVGQQGDVVLTTDPGAPLAKGRHTVVAFAATDEDATASAWTFTVR